MIAPVLNCFVEPALHRREWELWDKNHRLWLCAPQTTRQSAAEDALLHLAVRSSRDTQIWRLRWVLWLVESGGHSGEWTWVTTATRFTLKQSLSSFGISHHTCRLSSTSTWDLFMSFVLINQIKLNLPFQREIDQEINFNTEIWILSFIQCMCVCILLKPIFHDMRPHTPRLSVTTSSTLWLADTVKHSPQSEESLSETLYYVLKLRYCFPVYETLS